MKKGLIQFAKRNWIFGIDMMILVAYSFLNPVMRTFGPDRTYRREKVFLLLLGGISMMLQYCLNKKLSPKKPKPVPMQREKGTGWRLPSVSQALKWKGECPNA